MSYPTSFLEVAVLLSLVLLTVSFLLIAWRIIVGPSLADRIIALDMLVAVGLGFIAVIGVKTGFYLYIDIAIALGLVGFLATVAFARFVLSHGDDSEFVDEGEAEEARAKADKALNKAGEQTS
ncbi:MAG: cation:proton antiporter [Cohaesibacter sp.]|nr:cation:proton antiporter [Cohaesibacter sp.]MCV6602243.1 cation:proton antiporter [Cohaesibacter sp.]